MREAFTIRPAVGELMYRLVGRSTPRLRDFQSDRDKGRPRVPSQGYADYLGISVFESEELASRNAARYPAVIAAVRLDAAHGFDLASTYPDIEGHHTVWGEPSQLLEQVERIVTHDVEV